MDKTIFNDDEIYASLTGENRRLYEITLCDPEYRRREFERKGESSLLAGEEEAYRRYYELNIKYDPDYDEDENYNGDIYSQTAYGNAVEALVDYYAMTGDTENAVEKAKELLRIREDVKGGYVTRGYADLMITAVYKLAWLTKDRMLFNRALWLARNSDLYAKIKKMMSRCDFPIEPAKKLLPEWEDFSGLAAENGIDLTKDKTQWQLHDEYTLGRGDYIENLSEYKKLLDEKDIELAREEYYIFSGFIGAKSRLDYYEGKEEPALYHLRTGERDRAEKLCRSAITNKYNEYINRGLRGYLASLALSFYHLGYITGHREPMDRALDYMRYVDDSTLNEDIEKITAIRDRYF